MLPSHPMCYIQTILFLLVCESVVAYNLEVSHRVVTLPSVLMLCFEYLLLRGVTALKYECATLPPASQMMRLQANFVECVGMVAAGMLS